MARPRSGIPWKKKSWKRPAYGGGHLQSSLKNQTPSEVATTKQYFADGKARWDYLFHPDRNKWHLIK